LRYDVRATILRRPVSKPLLLCACLLLLWIAACVASRGCGCGQEFDRDPLDPESEFFVSADHAPSDHCYCRCGDGPKEQFPPSRTCDGYEEACERDDGSIAQLTCD
jgi:hypothetical protein